MCKNLPVFNLSNEEEDLIPEIEAINEIKIKEGKNLCKCYIENFNKAK